MSIFRAIVDSAPQAFLVVDGERQITLASRGAEQLFGYGPAELVGCQLEVLVPERLREKHPVYVRTFQEAPQARAMGVGRDLQARRKDGSEVSVEIGLTPLRTTAGSFTLAAIIDITERKRQADLLRAGHAALELRSAELERCIAERTLQLDDTRRTLQTLLDALPSMIGYWDTGLINRFANEAYRNWFGDAGSNLVGKHLLTLLGSDLFEQNRPFVQAALQGKAQTFERDIPRPDGAGVRHALAHYLPDVVEGEVRGFCVLVHDITEITESKQRLARSLQEREVMLQEIHHRVKNNLQVVSSLLNLQLRRISRSKTSRWTLGLRSHAHSSSTSS